MADKPSGPEFQNSDVLQRAIVPPSTDEFDDLISAARSAARRTGMKKTDIKTAIVKVRSRRAAKRDGK